jgi:hypothetical protein
MVPLTPRKLAGAISQNKVSLEKLLELWSRQVRCFLARGLGHGCRPLVLSPAVSPGPPTLYGSARRLSAIHARCNAKFWTMLKLWQSHSKRSGARTRALLGQR